MRSLILMIVLVILVSSCSPKAEESGPKVIGLAMPEIKGSFWTSIYYGVSEEAKALGYELIAVEAGGFQNVDRQISQIEDLIQREVDIMIVGATSAEGVGPVVDEAVDAGIPVIGVSSLPQSEKLLAKVGADHYGMGVLNAQCIGDALGGEGQVAMMLGPSGVIWAQLRNEGFKDTMSAEYPNIEIVSELNQPTGRDEGVTHAENWLQVFPELAAVYTVTDDSGAGFADALAAAGKEGDVVIATCNLSPIGREYLLAGKIHCEAIQQIVLQGRTTVQIADAHFKGETFEPVVMTDVLMVTVDNIDELDMAEFQAPADFVPDL